MVKLTIKQGELVGSVELWCYVANPSDFVEYVKTSAGVRLLNIAPGARGNRDEEVDIEINNWAGLFRQ